MRHGTSHYGRSISLTWLSKHPVTPQNKDSTLNVLSPGWVNSPFPVTTKISTNIPQITQEATWFPHVTVYMGLSHSLSLTHTQHLDVCWKHEGTTDAGVKEHLAFNRISAQIPGSDSRLALRGHILKTLTLILWAAASLSVTQWPPCVTGSLCQSNETCR